MAHSLFAGLVPARSRQDLLAAGVTPAQLRGSGWQRTSYGRYLPSGTDVQAPLQRILDAGQRLPSRGAVAGWGAARALRVQDCDGFDVDGTTLLDVPLAVGDQRIRSGGGVQLWWEPLPDDDLVEIDGLRFTSSRRTCLDRMRRADDVREAVVVADQMMRSEVVGLPEMREYVAAHAGWRGIGQARRVLGLCDPMARNGWETRMRMVWMLGAGLPRPLCNPALFDLREGLLGFPDLFDPVAGVVFEYDGAGHRRTRRHDSDNIREELFEDHGLVVARVGRAQLADSVSLAERMRRTRVRGLRRDRRADRWTLEAPADWGEDLGGDVVLESIFATEDAHR